MKLYVITIEEIWDYDRLGHDPEVYVSQQVARKRLAEIAELERPTYQEALEDSLVEEIYEDMFEFYEDGCWAQTHLHAEISECELELTDKIG